MDGIIYLIGIIFLCIMSFKKWYESRVLKKQEKKLKEKLEKELKTTFNLNIRFESGKDKTLEEFKHVSVDKSGLYVIMADNQEYYFEWELLDNVLFVPNVVEKHV